MRRLWHRHKGANDINHQRKGQALRYIIDRPNLSRSCDRSSRVGWVIAHPHEDSLTQTMYKLSNCSTRTLRPLVLQIMCYNLTSAAIPILPVHLDISVHHCWSNISNDFVHNLPDRLRKLCGCVHAYTIHWRMEWILTTPFTNYHPHLTPDFNSLISFC